jgi:hypothetical protein
LGSRVLPQDHFCPWREEAEELHADMDRLRAEVEVLKRRVMECAEQQRCEGRSLTHAATELGL